MGKIGLQLYSIWRDTEKDFLGTIQKVAELGYEGVQFAGFYDTPAHVVKQVMERNALASAGAHIGIKHLLNEEQLKTFEYQNIIGNKLIICPGIPEELRQSADDYKAIADTLNLIGDACQDEGFTFAYHNHDFEFRNFGDQTGYELLMEHTDPEFVKIELDCYWAQYAGQDPLKLIDKYKNRIVSLHMKDMKRVGVQMKGTEVGNGELDFDSVIKSANDHKVDWFTVEQEEFDRDPYESLSINLANMRDLMSK